ncbi:MAG: hypothetical protein NXH97_07155 [Rhodobacteraceae bacterium]|nr:hypothetical protein [Paracoccaceae bacterium]
MTRNSLIYLVALCICATSARAEWVTVQCIFETECYEAEACDGAGLTLQLSAGDAPGEVVMRSPGETVVGQTGGSDATSLIWSAETESAAHLLSWGADGTARYSVHLLYGPETVSYLGRCETQS